MCSSCNMAVSFHVSCEQFLQTQSASWSSLPSRWISLETNHRVFCSATSVSLTVFTRGSEETTGKYAYRSTFQEVFSIRGGKRKLCCLTKEPTNLFQPMRHSRSANVSHKKQQKTAQLCTDVRPQEAAWKVSQPVSNNPHKKIQTFPSWACKDIQSASQRKREKLFS